MDGAISKTKLMMAVLVAGLALIALLLVTGSDSSDPTDHAVSQPLKAAHNERPLNTQHKDLNQSQTPGIGFQSQVAPLPRTLLGVDLSGGLAVDERGHLRISSDLKRVFDAFLSGVDEESLDTILARVDEYLEHYLDEPAIGQARTIFAQYIGYKTVLFEYEKTQLAFASISRNEYESTNLVALTERMNYRNELRQQFLSLEVREAFFGKQEEYDEYVLAHLRIKADQSLSEDDKHYMLDRLNQLSSERIVHSRYQTQAVDQLALETAKLISEGGTNVDVRALRTRMFGSEAADRFDELDRERAEWQNRVDAFMDARQTIMENQGLSDSDKKSEVDYLRTSSFNAREQIRVRYFETQQPL